MGRKLGHESYVWVVETAGLAAKITNTATATVAIMDSVGTSIAGNICHHHCRPHVVIYR